MDLGVCLLMRSIAYTGVRVCVIDLAGSRVRRGLQARVPEDRVHAMDPLSRQERQ